MMTLVCYDVSDDTGRARVAAALQQHGDRIQRSVFLCQLDPADLPALLTRLTALIDTGHDSVYALPVCGSCWAGVHVLGQAHAEPPDLYRAVL